MATPALSRLRRVLVWAKAGNKSPKVSSSRHNFFIHVLVAGARRTLQQLRDASPQRRETVRASQPPVACNGWSWPVGVIQTARARLPPAAFGRTDKSNSACARALLGNRGALAIARTTKS